MILRTHSSPHPDASIARRRGAVTIQPREDRGLRERQAAVGRCLAQPADEQPDAGAQGGGELRGIVIEGHK